MSSNTKYKVQSTDAEGNVTEGEGSPVSRLDKAKDLAAALHLSFEGSRLVQVVTEAGNVSFEIPAVELEAEVEALVAADADEAVVAEAEAVVARSKPWTRTEVAKFDAPEIEGYTLAYTRSRVKTAIYRADDKSGWLILDTRTGDKYTSTNTEEGRQITNRLSDEYNAQSKAEREAAAAARKEAREAKRAAKAAEAAAAAEAKAAAKAAKEEAADKELDGASA